MNKALVLNTKIENQRMFYLLGGFTASLAMMMIPPLWIVASAIWTTRWIRMFSIVMLMMMTMMMMMAMAMMMLPAALWSAILMRRRWSAASASAAANLVQLAARSGGSVYCEFIVSAKVMGRDQRHRLGLVQELTAHRHRNVGHDPWSVVTLDFRTTCFYVCGFVPRILNWKYKKTLQLLMVLLQLLGCCLSSVGRRHAHSAIEGWKMVAGPTAGDPGSARSLILIRFCVDDVRRRDDKQ